MNNIPAIVGCVSVPLYFCGSLLIFFWHGTGDDAILVILAIFFFPFFALSVVAGIITGLITFALLSSLFDRHASDRTDAGGRA
jgi:hypothetical protein